MENNTFKKPAPPSFGIRTAEVAKPLVNASACTSDSQAWDGALNILTTRPPEGLGQTKPTKSSVEPLTCVVPIRASETMPMTGRHGPVGVCGADRYGARGRRTLVPDRQIVRGVGNSVVSGTIRGREMCLLQEIATVGVPDSSSASRVRPPARLVMTPSRPEFLYRRAELIIGSAGIVGILPIRATYARFVVLLISNGPGLTVRHIPGPRVLTYPKSQVVLKALDEKTAKQGSVSPGL